MPLFLIVYIIIAVIITIAIFLLSYNEKENKYIKTALTVIYILSIIGIILATGYLETKCSYSKLTSSIISAAIVGFMYGADSLGGKLALKKKG